MLRPLETRSQNSEHCLVLTLPISPLNWVMVSLASCSLALNSAISSWTFVRPSRMAVKDSCFLSSKLESCFWRDMILVTDEKTLGSVITDCLLVSRENTSLHFMTENMMLRYSSRSNNKDSIHRCKSFNYIEQYRRKGWYSNMYCPDPEEPYWHN